MEIKKRHVSSIRILKGSREASKSCLRNISPLVLRFDEEAMAFIMEYLASYQLLQGCLFEAGTSRGMVRSVAS